METDDNDSEIDNNMDVPFWFGKAYTFVYLNQSGCRTSGQVLEKAAYAFCFVQFFESRSGKQLPVDHIYKSLSCTRPGRPPTSGEMLSI